MIAGYVTANITHLGGVIKQDDRPQIVNYESFANDDYSGFDSILSLYLRKNKRDRETACFGVAGPVIKNVVTTTNLPWVINGEDIKAKYEFDKVTIVNDIVASAKGMFFLKEENFFTINKGVKVENGNFGLISPGAGLGEGLVFYDGEKYCPYASEGGHVGFSPGSQLEIELWEFLYSLKGYVEAEDIISLRGLINIYEFTLMHNRATKADWFKKANDKQSDIIEMALSGKDEIAVKSLDLFVDCFAHEAANLALKGTTLSGIYLGGLIVPKIIPLLDKGRFMEKFVHKGKMENFLANTPVYVIIDDRTALLGAGSIAVGIEK